MRPSIHLPDGPGAPGVAPYFVGSVPDDQLRLPDQRQTPLTDTTKTSASLMAIGVGPGIGIAAAVARLVAGIGQSGVVGPILALAGLVGLA
ncbi:MAG: hypothetical protein ACYCX9_00945 [Candidatus Dormibacteria bacterium]